MKDFSQSSDFIAAMIKTVRLLGFTFLDLMALALMLKPFANH